MNKIIGSLTLTPSRTDLCCYKGIKKGSTVNIIFIVLSCCVSDPYAAYGLKVIGGKKTDDGKLGAFITDIRKGGPADRQAQLLIGN